MFDNVAFSQLSNTVLEIRVLDAYVGKKPKFLGAVRLGTGASDAPFDDPSTKECTFWQKMMQEPNKSSTATLPLRSTAASLKRLIELDNRLHRYSVLNFFLLLRDALTETST